VPIGTRRRAGAEIEVDQVQGRNARFDERDVIVCDRRRRALKRCRASRPGFSRRRKQGVEPGIGSSLERDLQFAIAYEVEEDHGPDLVKRQRGLVTAAARIFDVLTAAAGAVELEGTVAPRFLGIEEGQLNRGTR
jgi:hypothetical protein